MATTAGGAMAAAPGRQRKRRRTGRDDGLQEALAARGLPALSVASAAHRHALLDLDEYESASDVALSEDEAEVAAWLRERAGDAWEAGLSASEDDSDGGQDTWPRAADACTQEELIQRRKEKLVKLHHLYEAQFQTVRRALEEKHDAYVEARTQAMQEHPEPEPPSRIPASKRRLVAMKDLPGRIEVDDLGYSPLHRYNRPRGVDAALRIQKKRRVDTGSGYSSVGTGVTNPNARVRCTFHPPHLPPCLDRALPFSKYCTRHILKDKAQQLYKPCQFKAPVTNKQCDQPVLKFEHPSVCLAHISFADFVRNPRLYDASAARAGKARTFSFSDSMGSSAGYELVAAALGTQLAESALGDQLDDLVERNLAMKEIGDVMSEDEMIGEAQQPPSRAPPAAVPAEQPEAGAGALPGPPSANAADSNQPSNAAAPAPPGGQGERGMSPPNAMQDDTKPHGTEARTPLVEASAAGAAAESGQDAGTAAGMDVEPADATPEPLPTEPQGQGTPTDPADAAEPTPAATDEP